MIPQTHKKTGLKSESDPELNKLIASTEHLHLGGNNTEPWARTSPADPAGAMRITADTISDADRKQLLAWANEFENVSKKLIDQCGPTAMEAIKLREAAILNDPTIEPSDAYTELRDLKAKREMAQTLEEKLRRHAAELRSKFVPASQKILAGVLTQIDESLRNVPTLAGENHWGLNSSIDWRNVYTYPLLRLRSMIYGQVHSLHFQLSWEPQQILQLAGVLER